MVTSATSTGLTSRFIIRSKTILRSPPAVKKRFKYITLRGAHEPHVYVKDLNVLESSLRARDVIEANFTMLDLFLSQMKEAGVYDNTCHSHHG